MTQPVFITGFERSGTTLLRRLVSMWPGFEKDLIHEGRKLLGYKTRQESENNYKDEYSSIKSGEKIPYYNNSDFITDYITKFKEFWPDSIIFHIVRLPADVAASCKRTFYRPKNITHNAYAENVTKVINFLRDESNIITVMYEALIKNPEKMLYMIYDKLGNVPDDEVLNKILNTREPWMLGNRRMPGLRYNDTVGKVKH